MAMLCWLVCSQMIVHSKAFSVLLGMLFGGDTSVLSTWLLYEP